jgi:hypothetical protein
MTSMNRLLLLLMLAGASRVFPQEIKTAEQVYPNIEILKGMPADRVPLIMGVFNRVLGVECTHCHVESAMEKGDKPTFAKARRMFQVIIP